MILATTTVEDVDRFLKVFGTKGADKRALHGSKRLRLMFRDHREKLMWLFEWDGRGGRPTLCSIFFSGVADSEGSRRPRQAGMAALLGGEHEVRGESHDEDATSDRRSLTTVALLMVYRQRQPRARWLLGEIMSAPGSAVRRAVFSSTDDATE